MNHRQPLILFDRVGRWEREHAPEHLGLLAEDGLVTLEEGYGVATCGHNDVSIVHPDVLVVYNGTWRANIACGYRWRRGPQCEPHTSQAANGQGLRTRLRGRCQSSRR